MPIRLWTTGGLSTVRRLGLLGSVLIALASYFVGALPRDWSPPLFAAQSIVPRVVFYLGLAGLFAAWFAVGRRVSTADVDPGWLRRSSMMWAAPLLFAMPLQSRDLWAYAAQDKLLQYRLDPYAVGPAVLAGPFSDQVDPRWMSSPEPYGPLWVAIGRVMGWAGGNSVLWSMYLLRVPVLLGFLLLLWCMPRLAERAGGRADRALWLTAANPLVLLLGIAGGHNDVLMVGLIGCGLVVATGRRSLWRGAGAGAAVTAAGAAIKSPGLIALAFVVPLWLAGRRLDRRQIARACGVAVVSAVSVFAVLSAVAGVGLGWTHQISSDAPVVNWMSIPTALALGWKVLTGVVHDRLQVDATVRQFRNWGAEAAGLVLVGLWFAALRFRPWVLLAVALFSVVVLAPMVQPWYFTWTVLVAAALPLSRHWTIWIAGMSAAMVLMIRPNGDGWQMSLLAIPYVAGSLGLAALALAVRRSERTLVPA